MTDLYRNEAQEGEVSAGFTFDEAVVTQLLHTVYDQRIDVSREINADLFHEVHRVFDKAAANGINAHVVQDAGYDFLQELKSSNGVFSAFKAHRFQNDIAGQLFDADGQLKSFEQFRADTQSIVSHHKDSWLRTEYDTAIKRARKAAQMRQFRTEADVLPNLQWLASTALNPRESHMPFYNRIWPIDDPFWQEHKPGDDWGCQCDWEATDAPPTDNTGLDPQQAPPARGLRSNPARDGRLFSDDHPYFPDKCRGCAFNSSALQLFYNKDKDCYHCKAVDDVVRAARAEQRKRLTEKAKEVRQQIVGVFGYDALIPLPAGRLGGTGKLRLTPQGLRNCLRVHTHTKTDESKQVLFAAVQHPEQLRHSSRKPLGATKDMQNPADAANVARKRDRGVVAYNYYEFGYNNKIWVLGFEELEEGYEQPYFIALKK